MFYEIFLTVKNPYAEHNYTAIDTVYVSLKGVCKYSEDWLIDLCNKELIDDLVTNVNDIIQKSSYKLLHHKYYSDSVEIIKNSIKYESLEEKILISWSEYTLSFLSCYTPEEEIEYLIYSKQKDNEIGVLKQKVVNEEKGICEIHAHVIDNTHEISRSDFVIDDLSSCMVEV